MDSQKMKRLEAELADSRRLLTALGDEARRKLLFLIASSGREGVRAADLAARSALTRSAVSHHVQILKNAGIVACRREGKSVYYLLDADCRSLDTLLDLLEDLRGAVAGKRLDLLVTLNSGYLHQLCVMLTSVLQSNSDASVNLYVLHSSLTEDDLARIRAVLGADGTLFPIRIDDAAFADAPTTGRYPREMYYRIFAAQYLPQELERVLYLDPDVIVKGSLADLCRTPLDGALFAAASHVGNVMTRINSVRLAAKQEDCPYINSGVMLMNLKRLRQVQRRDEVFDYIEKHRNMLILPDQDIISGLYGSEIILLDPYRYNMTERMFTWRLEAEAWMDLDWVRTHSVIIHYCGRNKPWKPGYAGMLGMFYKEAEARYEALCGA